MIWRTSLPCIAMGLALLSSAAFGQEIRLDQPVERQDMPSQLDAPVKAIDATPPVRDSTPVRPDGAGATAMTGMLTLRPLGRLPRVVRMGASLPEPSILRLTGEAASIDLSLDLPEGQAVPETLNLVLRSAINVLPESATLSISINGSSPIEFPLNHFGEFDTAHVPAAGLQPGSNIVGLSLRQPHRIFCGPEASFGVWTEFDLSRSGVEVPSSALSADASGFALLLENEVGAGRALTVLADLQGDPAVLRLVTDSLGAAMQGRVSIEIRSFYDTAPRHRASVAVIASDTGRIRYLRDHRGGMTMIIEHAAGTLPDLSDALSTLALPAKAQVAMLVPGETYSLADLGVDDIVGNTHYFRHDLDFRLPDGWLLLANQKAKFDLEYGFAEDLPKASILLVKVNDETVRLLPLAENGGRILEPLTISFGTRLLHSGINSLSVEMMVPGNPTDSACQPRTTDLLVVTKESTLQVPRSPTMQWGGSSSILAELTAAGVSVDPEVANRAELELVAMQLAAGLTPPEAPDPAVSLTLLDFNRLPVSLATVSFRDLQAVLFPRPIRTPATVSPVPRTVRLSEKQTGDAQQPMPVAGALHAPATLPTSSWSPVAWAERQRARMVKAAFLNSGQSLAEWLDGRRGDALLLPLDRSEPRAIGLLLGPDAQIRGISRALDELRTNRVGVSGAALISNDGSWQIWSPMQLPRLNEPLTPLNLFPVLGNFASWSPLLFTALLLGLGLVSVVPALAIVIIFRIRRLR